MKTIGVLDLQGGVHEHMDHLEQLGVPAVRVKTKRDFKGLCGLIIPGGESTCLARLLRIFELDTVILREYHNGLKLWGTCAGAILVAHEIRGEAPHLDLMNITVERNAFGSQLDSFSTTESVPDVSPEPIPLTFIRAPQIVAAGDDVKVLLRLKGFIAAAESETILATVFHPELTPSLAFHRYFACKCGVLTASDVADSVTGWSRKSWMRQARGKHKPEGR